MSVLQTRVKNVYTKAIHFKFNGVNNIFYVTILILIYESYGKNRKNEERKYYLYFICKVITSQWKKKTFPVSLYFAVQYKHFITLLFIPNNRIFYATAFEVEMDTFLTNIIGWIIIHFFLYIENKLKAMNVTKLS